MNEIPNGFNPETINNESDLSAVTSLIERGVTEGHLQPRTREEIEAVEANFILCRKLGGEIVGCVSLDVYTPRLAEIHSLYVTESFRGLGLGKHLIERAIFRAREKNISEVIAITDKIPLFKDAGFSEILRGQKALFMRL